jgi:peptide/nickel transport system permease protein
MLRFLLLRYFSDWRNYIPLVIIAIFLFTAAIAPLISPSLNEKQPGYNRVVGIASEPEPPGDEFILGTYAGGYDVFHTLIWGTRSALWFGLRVALSTAVIGILVGATSSIIGGVIGRLGMRITDAFLAFPTLAGIMLFTQILKPNFIFSVTTQLTPFQQFIGILHIEPISLALILFSWMSYSRLTYVSIEQQKEQEYVSAAKVMGLSNWKIFFRHILPNIVSPLTVLFTRDIGGMVILEAALIFIGIKPLEFHPDTGFIAPTIAAGPEWGQMLADAKNWIIGPTLGFAYWWTFIPVTLALILFSVGWQLLGQRINAVLNPRTFSFLK